MPKGRKVSGNAQITLRTSLPYPVALSKIRYHISLPEVQVPHPIGAHTIKGCSLIKDRSHTLFCSSGALLEDPPFIHTFFTNYPAVFHIFHSKTIDEHLFG